MILEKVLGKSFSFEIFDVDSTQALGCLAFRNRNDH
jgi:hypothetical protein